MGSFFANISILSKHPITEAVASAMKALGHFPSEIGEPLYLLPNNGKWQTLHLDMSNPVAELLHDALAKSCEAMLAICCVDSDFMTLELTRSGATETVCIGEPYDPAGIEAVPSPEHWQPIVCNPDALQKILAKDYVCAEDSLEDLSCLFGFDAAQINITPGELENNPPENMIVLRYENSAPSSIERMRQSLLNAIPQIDLRTGYVPEEFHQAASSLVNLFFDTGED